MQRATRCEIAGSASRLVACDSSNQSSLCRREPNKFRTTKHVDFKKYNTTYLVLRKLGFNCSMCIISLVPCLNIIHLLVALGIRHADSSTITTG